MTNTVKKERFSFRHCLFAFLILTVCFAVVHFAASFALSKIGYFEKYYSLASWLCYIVTGIITAVIWKQKTPYMFLYHATPSLCLSVLIILTALIFGNEDTRLLLVAAKCACLILLSFAVPFIKIRSKGNSRRKFKKYRY